MDLKLSIIISLENAIKRGPFESSGCFQKLLHRSIRNITISPNFRTEPKGLETSLVILSAPFPESSQYEILKFRKKPGQKGG